MNFLNALGLDKLLGGLAGSAAKKDTVPNNNDAASEKPVAENKEHSKAGTDLAKAPAQNKALSPQEYIEAIFPKNPEAFKSRDLKKVFAGLEKIADPKLKAYLDTLDLDSIADFKAFTNVKAEIEELLNADSTESDSKPPQASADEELNNVFAQLLGGAAPAKNKASKGKELEELGQGLAAIEQMLGGLEAAEAQANPKNAKQEKPTTEKPDDAKADKAKTEEAKVTLAKQEPTAKQGLKELDALLSQLTAA